MSFNPSSPSSIIEFAQNLKGKTLREVCEVEIEEHGYGGKGNFGQILEKFYFGYEPNSVAEPDFAEAKLELKTSPLKKLMNGSFRSKERLVLNIINYLKVHEEEFEESTFWKKNAHLLLIFYLYEKEKDKLDYLIPLVDGWSYPSKDLEIIKKDWEAINAKIKNGKAHELSESDTFYLGACTKGSKGANLREQPFNEEKAPQRAYSLKQGYVNHIIASIAKDEQEEYGVLIPSLEEAENKTIDEVVAEKFKPYLGNSISEIIELINIDGLNTKSKNFHSRVVNEFTRRIFEVPKGILIEDYIEEFRKADVKIKTVRLDEKGRPCEDVSLPAFSYHEIYDGSWRGSNLKEYIERKYLFVFFKYHKDGKLYLNKVKFWNMSSNDMELGQKIWLDLKRLIINGNIVKSVSEKGRRQTYFPDIKTSNIHIRPHALNSNDTHPLPVMDKTTEKKEYTKHSFWFNKDYIKDVIYPN